MSRGCFIKSLIQEFAAKEQNQLRLFWRTSPTKNLKSSFRSGSLLFAGQARWAEGRYATQE
jgi:hypothetical protein